MGDWVNDGHILGYTVEGGLGALRWAGDLHTNGVVADAQIVTRMQYILSTNNLNRMQAVAQFDFTGWEGDSPGSGWAWGAAMFIAPAWAVPSAAPNVEQIINNSTSVTRYELFSWNGGNDFTFVFNGPHAYQLGAGTKHWLAVIPTWYRIGSTPSVANDRIVVYGTGSANTIGRGISFWTNRPPSKPKITSPPNNYIEPYPGDDIEFSYEPSAWGVAASALDPDAIYPYGPGIEYSGINGVQLQYAAPPSASNPAPEWKDLTFSVAGYPKPTWHIAGSTHADNGPSELLTDLGIPIQTAVDFPDPGKAGLPSGTWMLRMRTFDAGHPYPVLSPINGRAFADYSPTIYPDFNISEWSDSITLTIPAAVPPPIPLSPINSAGVPISEPVVLRWRYRNSSSTPMPQYWRNIQIRNIKDAGNEDGGWLLFLYGDVSPNTFWTIPDGYLEVGEAYEWRVMVSDGTNMSNFSTPARFYVVPAPGSGNVIPSPGEMLAGATLGCGRHRVFVYRRGGTARVGEITGLAQVEWNRVRDEISEARIVIADWDLDCGNLLAMLRTWAYELVIYRDNGYSMDRVWEGPITLLTYKSDEVTIKARDVMAFAYRRIIKQTMNDTGQGATVVARAAQILQNVFAPDDPNILANMVPMFSEGDAVQYRSTPAYSRTAYEEIDDMASNAGLDYTAVGRSIMLWGTKHRVGTLPEFRDENFGAAPIVSEYGMSLATRYAVSDGNGVWGEAARYDNPFLGTNDIYGLVEMLSSSWASDSVGLDGTYTEEQLAEVRASFQESAEHSITDRYPAPIVVRVPDNTTLSPETVVSIQHLVPGVAIPLRSTGTLRHYFGLQKLDAVKVVEEAGRETISITLSPFNRADEGGGVENEETPE